MKKQKLIILFLLSALLFTLPAHAETTAYTEESNANVNAFASTPLSDAELSVLLNTSYYHTDMEGITVAGKPIIKVYNYAYWELSNTSFENIIFQADQSERMDYVILGNEPIRISKVLWQDEILIYRYPKSISNFIVENIFSNVELFGKQCTVSEIYIFDETHSHAGAFVYLITDQGNFVKYYETALSSAVVFTEEMFLDYAASYYQYVSSYEYNYDENGAPKGGGTVSFLSYIEHNASNNTENPNSNATENNGSKSIETNDSDFKSSYAIICFIAFAAILLGIVTYFLIKKKASKQN